MPTDSTAELSARLGYACNPLDRRAEHRDDASEMQRHRASPDKAREIAHVSTAATLETWIQAARRILKSGGVLSLIWRADGLVECYD